MGAIAFLAGLGGVANSPLSVILVLFFIGVPGILAIIFGFIGISTANRLGGQRRRHAVAGVVLGFSPFFAIAAGSVIHGLIARVA